MERFQKRLRIFVESLGGEVSDEHNDSLSVKMRFGTACFESTSYNSMTCSVVVDDVSRRIKLDKAYCFDIVDRISSNHFCKSVLSYPKPRLLEFDDYITEEHGANLLLRLQAELLHNTKLAQKKLGGNRILAEFYVGILVLRDDLVSAGTNVYEFNALTPRINATT
jgi:hypothetical protein